ncbi:hypothetical protein BD626DRAFT_493552 [Schizophyllum amplum]|uniref:F-box domain-containing protein n=1 Tax=Schizophyllum amplum TaxID=97359 RepID=A0A550CGU7_9AGAR|nr:hypothetical protein BD626DRAFT_493552 [Auriculariopsis ampla]
MLDNSDNCQFLRELAFSDIEYSSQRITRRLRQLPSIEKLSITENIFSSGDPPVWLSLILALTRDGTRASDDFLPRLDDLELDYRFLVTTVIRADDVVRRMVDSRLCPRERDGKPLVCFRKFSCQRDRISLRPWRGNSPIDCR